MMPENSPLKTFSLRIAVDAMGGDFGPASTMPAVLQQALAYPEVEFIVYGHRDQCRLNKCELNTSPANLRFHHIEQQISMSDVPTHALRYGRQSSMAMALHAVKDGSADACITAGNTGALVALARHILGIYASIDKPALCKIMPTHLGRSYMLDLGATINCSSEQLIQFARLGVALYQCDNTDTATVSAKPNKIPSVRLLNIGSEHFKGMDVIRHAAEGLQAISGLDYQGYIEGDSIYKGVADIIVCDGFVGNIALKSSEGVARFMLESFYKAFDMASADNEVEQGQSLPAAIQLWQTQSDPARYNGAQLLGVKGLVVKSHGGVDGHAFSQALAMLVEQVKRQSNTCFEELLGLTAS